MIDTKLENTKVQLRKGTIEYCTLLVVSRGQVYTTDILQALKDCGLIVVEGTIYPLLSRLRVSGYLKYSWQESEVGPPRKYYELTEEGRGVLLELNQTWRQLVETIQTLTVNSKLN
jgi:PadR family transcriptional regulator PadR